MVVPTDISILSSPIVSVLLSKSAGLPVSATSMPILRRRSSRSFTSSSLSYKIGCWVRSMTSIRSACLLEFGVPYVVLFLWDQLHLGMVKSGDLVIILTKSGSTVESIHLVDYLEQRESNIWLLSFNEGNYSASRVSTVKRPKHCRSKIGNRNRATDQGGTEK